ncbi:PTS lactose/cellobiose transporter subunit IIA [Enterococcus sp. DIV1059_2]|uniref:PTS lactose/cellobiose transporter subunit IIA n=1 Tax=Enterococcus sp. DIV1059_2 TaxID=2774664 RepID=UPI003F217541
MDNYEVSFTLILHAGNAKSAAMMAIEAAREGTFEEARRLLEEAKNELQQAHQCQTDLVQAEARGEKTELSIILIHAQDHLAMAMTATEQAAEWLYLYQKISELQGGVSS